MFCPNCGSKLPDGAAFCSACGAKTQAGVPGVCTACGAELPEGAEFCIGCGNAVNPAAPQAVHTLGTLACVFAPQAEQKAAPSDSLFPQLGQNISVSLLASII